MRYSLLIFFLSFSVFFVAAQKIKPPVYFYTSNSTRYLNDPAIDSLLYSSSARIFSENMIPVRLFGKKYPQVKSVLVALSKKDIVLAFKTIEAMPGKKMVAEKGSAQFNDNKQLYTEALVKQIRNTFYTNKSLSQYLSFNSSDRITYFNSTVQVQKDGNLLVEEKITVYNGNGQPNPVYGNDSSLLEAGAMNNEIKRGIVRAFPLYYINKYKLFQNTTFTLKEVLRNGKKEDYHTREQENGILVYTGNSNTFLDPGTYTYTITYETGNQLKLLKGFDELYWNVTGNGWSFRIDSARCTVILPEGTNVLSSKCYTGPQGVAGDDCSFMVDAVDGKPAIIFKTTKPLPPRQGITIASSWPKGIVSGPGRWQELKDYIWNNKAVFFLPIAALFSVVFCFACWMLYGRDPKKGTVYPQFEPPAGYSPAALGYIREQKFTRQLTAATIVDAAVRNKIKIEVAREGRIFKHNEYLIVKSDKPAKQPLIPYEEFDNYVEDLIDSSIEKGKYNSDLGDLNNKLQNFCESTYKMKSGKDKNKVAGFFKLNGSYMALPVLVCLAAGGWGFFEGIVKAVKLQNFWQIGYFIAGIILCVIVFRIFSRLLPAYSAEGRKLMDKTEGFRMFLSTADEKRFDLMNPPAKSLELYEKYLPFAIALGCEIEWGKKFEEIINTAYATGAAVSSFSSSLSRDSHSFSSSFTSSFSGAISSASTPPSSSSGGGSSFGGGSSGGGGGGGGGGGW